MFGKQVGPCEPLLRIAARGGFPQLQLSGLQTLAKQVGCPIEKGTKLSVAVQRLATHVLGEVTDEELLDILSCRIDRQSDLLELMKTTEVSDLLTQDDLKAMQQMESEQHSKGIVQEELRGEVHALRRKIQESRAAGSSSSRARPGAAAKAKALAAWPARKYPAKVALSQDSWSEAYVQSLLPPGARVLRDFNNQRWLLSCYGIRRSRSWGLYGHSLSALLVVKIAWLRWEEDGFLPKCPIQGLLDLSEDAPAA